MSPNQNPTINPKEFLVVEGQILEALPGAKFRIKINGGHEILAYLSGKMRMHRITLLPGDRVKVEMSPYDLKQGRITYRF